MALTKINVCLQANLIQSNKYFPNLFVSSICLLLLLKIQYEWESSYFEYSNTVSANIPIDPHQMFFIGIGAFQPWTRCKCTCEPVECAHKTIELAVTQLLCKVRTQIIKHRLQCWMHAILMRTRKCASCIVCMRLILLLSLKPSSAELYCGQIAPEMFIGVFLTSHRNGLRAHFRTFYAI